MNKLTFLFMLLAAVITLVTGCYDRVDLEEQTSSFLVGFDLDDENKLITYATNPVFSNQAEKKSQEIGVIADTPRQSRAKLEARTFGFLSYRKVQIILIGKRLLQQENWYELMDVILRDPKNPLTPRIVAFNGALSEIIDLNMKDQPMLPLLLRGMVDSKSARSETVQTTFQELDRQIYEKGVTPYISEVILDKEKEIVMNGTTLLDHKGKYKATLSMPETVVLQILQKQVKSAASITLRIPGKSKTGPFDTDRLSFNAEKIKTKISTSYSQDRFHFGIEIKMPIVLTERLFAHDVQTRGKQLESMIAKQMKEKFESLIRLIQKNKIDPIGLGVYARAYQYKPYSKVKEHWGEALAKADIQVDVKVMIRSMGPVK
ncbi:Ger(x)C family spore germination protein [Paenibacillus eucommiae]|uniref:Ger(X)C family germination protein n=1 Tax=Paenibacillus eucommiae TaxID=1355755 RepID=A0ABS4J5M1_9BACL|nr:Ger(x)C family spore germination protein [Paenibacillus eucommiae]MBP1995137.1 Ger(x)C family germination protein [Paenibacillus eucommiae]